MKYAFFAFALMTAPAFAEVHEVKMLNRNEQGSMIYEPQFLRIQPGDSVKFLSSQPGHNAATIEGMLPEGATAFKSKINQDFEVSFEVPGTYGIKCSPHYAMGMVMLVQVGAEEIGPLPEGLPKRAEDRLKEIIAAAAQ
ncbi:pseudoazurin [Paracoccus aminophilus]|uniref:Pseudoazurin n=1 Tax=Paracoccus aminophilus JCM 7686 TaxID=1367847 RepID=S5Y7E8_PARAH|nr:pseudoazurin [Paracoccus aminophilus]AGT11445.1 putative pseudoazurin [Paracoccus aminophilus JCM 7686]